MEAMQMIDPHSSTAKSELDSPDRLFLEFDELAPEHQIWFRRKVYLKVALFMVCFVGVGLVMLMLN